MIIGIILLVMVTFPSDVNAQLLLGFTENFDDPALLGWETRWAKVDNGILQIEADGFAQRNAYLNNFELSILGNYDQGGIARIAYRKGENGAFLIQFAERFITLSCREGELGRFSHDIHPGEWAQITIIAIGDEQTILLNDHPVITIHSPSSLASTGIQLSATGSMVEFDKLTMTNMDPKISKTPSLNFLSRSSRAPYTASPTPGSPILRLLFTQDPAIYLIMILLLVTASILLRWRRK